MKSCCLPALVFAVACVVSPALAERQTIMTEDFEGAFPNGLWTVTGNPTWDDDDYNPRSGGWACWCANGGSAWLDPQNSNYPNNMNATMTYGPFDLSDAYRVTMTYWMWLDAECSYDFMRIRASSDGLNWTGDTYTCGTATWLSYSLNLDAFLGQPQVWISFNFTSDASNTEKGAFIDDVRLEKSTFLPMSLDGPAAEGSIDSGSDMEAFRLILFETTRCIFETSNRWGTLAATNVNLVDSTFKVVCSNLAGDNGMSRVSKVLAPGTYYLWVWGKHDEMLAHAEDLRGGQAQIVHFTYLPHAYVKLHAGGSTVTGTYQVQVQVAARVFGKALRPEPDNTGVAGVTIHFGGGRGSVITDSDGSYYADLAPGNFTVTPSKAGMKFVPASRSISPGPGHTVWNVDFLGIPEPRFIPTDGALDGSIDTAADSDWYYVSYKPGTCVFETANCWGETLSNAQMWCYDYDMLDAPYNVVAGTGDGGMARSLFSTNFEHFGTIQLRGLSGDTGTYTITASRLHELPLDQLVQAEIPAHKTPNWFSFEVTEPGHYTVESFAADLHDAAMSLYDDVYAQPLAHDYDLDDGQMPRLIAWLAPGTYYVRMRGADSNATGTYFIAVHHAATVNVLIYQFPGGIGPVEGAAVAFGGGRGSLVTQADGTCATYVYPGDFSVVPSKAGMVFSPFSQAVSVTAGGTASVQFAAIPAPIVIAPDGPAIDVEIAVVGGHDYYTFSMALEDRLVIEYDNTAGATGCLTTLSDPGGNFASYCSEGGISIADYDAGVHYVAFGFGLSQVGTYHMTISVLRELPIGQTVPANISGAGARHWYKCEIPLAGYYAVDTIAGSLAATVLNVSDDSSFEPIAEDDGGGGMARVLCWLDAGTHYVKVHAKDPSAVGTYQILVQRATHSISGTVRGVDSLGLPGVTVSFGGMHAPVQTDPAGIFTATGFDHNTTVAVSASRSGWRFLPARADVLMVADITNVEFLGLINGDANLDCKTNVLDLIFVRNRLRSDVNSGDNRQADVNGDDKVNVLDLIHVRNHLGTKCE